ncbi:hypothetical protein ACFQ6Q_00750 [Streptomyces sp. NPDC056437]|uniref:hypothetical protein n=1 Tax=Streptomyces sp. NPDC056437 TaxID=3345816 RepID=UPI0036CC465E
MLIPATSTEYLYVPVSAPAGVDLTGVPVKIAILPASKRGPEAEDWKTAEWAPAPTARILIGPSGAQTLTPGAYRVWITFDPPGSENLVELSGRLSVI